MVSPVWLLRLQAYLGLLELSRAREQFSEFCVPMVMVPATVSNNIPGSDLSIGADTALNAITEVSERVPGRVGTGSLWFGLAGSAFVQLGLVWSGLVWFDPVWSSLALLALLVSVFANHGSLASTSITCSSGGAGG